MKYGVAALVSLLSLAGIAADPVSPEKSPTPAVAVHAEGRGNPWLDLGDGFDLTVEYDRGQQVPAGARPTALVADDFDADGMPDLVTGFAEGKAGLLVLQRGNPGVIFPHLSTGTREPFFPSAVVVETPVAPDFLVAGDFDNDGHPDVVTTKLGGTTLLLHSGDGAGGLKPARSMDLAAEVTLLIAGDVNRVDRLFELIVGTNSPDGPELRVFESPKGAWNAAPEVFSLPAPATAATLGDHDRDNRADIAVVAGSKLVMIRGRDRKLAEGEKRIASVAPAKIETATLPFDANSIAFGDFTERRIGELAVLSYGGTLELVESTTARPIVTVETDVRGGKLFAANATTANGDDLIVVERNARQLHVMASAPQSTFARPELRATLTVDAEPVDVLSLRLNPDALGDLVVLRDAPGPAVAIAPSSPASIYTVTNTNDSGAGSLRRAINDANFYSGADAIHFNIPGAGAHSIHALSDLPAITDPVTIDGATQPGYAGTPLIEIHGTVGESGRDGLTITAGDSTVRGLAINRFSSDGIRLRDAGNNRIEGNYIGTDLAGGTVLANDDGIDVHGSGQNTVGGRIAGQGNLISGNDIGAYFKDGFNTRSSIDVPKAIPDSGVMTSTVSSTDTTLIEDLDIRVSITHPNVSDLEIYLIAPNTLRVALSTGNGGDGDDFLGTTFDDEASIAITDGHAPFFRVYRPEAPLSVLDGLPMAGTWTLEVRDTVTSNTGTLDDWDVIYRYDRAFENTVEGNRIGTDASGNVTLPNGTGVNWSGGPNYVGAPVAGAGNLISGNTYDEIYMSGAGGVVQGNLIGTNASGTSAIGFGFDTISMDGNGHQIGGAAVFAGNVITSSLGCGVYINGGTGQVVQGNLFGTDASGTAGLGGSGTGICIRGGAAISIGGTTSETRNVISDLYEGIRFKEFPWGAPVPFLPRGNVVIGNYIGTDIDGRGNLGHQTYGIVFEDGHENSIEDGNVICANGFDGVLIHREAFGNLIARNKIGIDVGGAPDPGNGGSGILIEGRYNVIEENVISGNQGHGIMMGNADTATLQTIVDTDVPLGVPDFGAVGTSVEFAEDAMVIDVDVQIDVDHTRNSDLVVDLTGPDLADLRLTTKNGGDGGGGYDGTTFDDEAQDPITEGTAPFVGSYRPEQPLASFDGISAQGWWWIRVLDDTIGEEGILRDYSVTLTTVATQGNQIHSNTIGLDEAHDEAVPNAGGGVFVGGAGNRVANNTIAGNLGPGVTIFGERAVGNIVEGNAIGIESPGTSLILGNRGDGVILDTNVGGAPVGNRIGAEGGGNSINYNAGAGVRVVAGSSNSIRENMIGANDDLGIDLGSPGVNENDPFDFDSGANGLQNFPVITSVEAGAWETVVEGFLESTPGRNFTIDLHVWQPDPSGYGEGDWIASQVVTTSPAGEAPFVFVVPGTMAFVTATATGQDGNTSEFSGAMTNVGAASEAGDMRAARLPGDEVEVSFFPACGATNHAIYRGVSPILGSLYFNDVACFVGTEGYATFDPGDPPPGQFFYFVVVGQNYAHEGSYGQDRFGAERPEAAGFGECDRPQVIAMACP